MCIRLLFFGFAFRVWNLLTAFGLVFDFKFNFKRYARKVKYNPCLGKAFDCPCLGLQPSTIVPCPLGSGIRKLFGTGRSCAPFTGRHLKVPRLVLK